MAHFSCVVETSGRDPEIVKQHDGLLLGSKVVQEESHLRQPEKTDAFLQEEALGPMPSKLDSAMEQAAAIQVRVQEVGS